MLKYFLTIVFTIFAAAASATTTTDDIRALLDNGNMDGLEKSFSRLHSSALEAKDFTEIRRIVFETMATTNEDRIGTINAWNEAYPESPYAKVSAAQMHLHIAFLYRGTDSSMRTPRPAVDKFREEINISISMADEAFSLAPDYLPASDLVMASSIAGNTDLKVIDLVGHVFSTMPNQKTLKNALFALQPAWGGSQSAMFELCAEFAEEISGYDANLCIVDAILENDLRINARKVALKIAESRLDELSEDSQLVALLDPGFPVEDGMAVRAVELHQKSLGRFNTLYEYNLQTWPLESKYSWPGYEQQAYDFSNAFIERALVDDPYNNELISSVIFNIFNQGTVVPWGIFEPTPDDMNTLWRLWTDQRRYGQYRPGYWKTGGFIAASEAKTGQKAFVAYPYYNNAIAASPQPHGALGSLLGLLHNDYNSAQRNISTANGFLNPDLPAPGAVLEFSTCEYVRVARVFQAFCTNTTGMQGECQTGYDRNAEAALALDNLDMLCPAVVNAPIIDLMYTPIPLDEFGKWGLENAPGN